MTKHSKMGSCSRTALKILKLCISSWQIADMISDAFNTAYYLNLASGVSKWYCTTF